MLCTSAGGGAGDAPLHGESSSGEGGVAEGAPGIAVAGVRARQRGGGAAPLPALPPLPPSGCGWMAGREA